MFCGSFLNGNFAAMVHGQVYKKNVAGNSTSNIHLIQLFIPVK